MAGAVSQAGDPDSSRVPGLTSGLQGSVNVHRGALLLVPQWQCISSFVFYILIIWFFERPFLVGNFKAVFSVKKPTELPTIKFKTEAIFDSHERQLWHMCTYYGSGGGRVVKLLACGARGLGFVSLPRQLNFRDWLSPASKSRYGWNTTNRMNTILNIVHLNLTKPISKHLNW